MEKFDVGASLAGGDRISPAGVYAEHVALFDDNSVLLENPHQVVVADELAVRAEARKQVCHDTTALDAGICHLLDSEIERPRSFRIVRAENIDAAAIAIVVDELLLAVLVGVERLADMTERIPLRGILRVEGHRIVTRKISPALVLVAHRKVDEVVTTGARRDCPFRRKPLRNEKIAAREIEWQAQTESDALPHLLGGFAPTFGRNEVEAPDLIVVAEISPVRVFRTNLPTLDHKRSSRTVRMVTPNQSPSVFPGAALLENLSHFSGRRDDGEDQHDAVEDGLQPKGYAQQIQTVEAHGQEHDGDDGARYVEIAWPICRHAEKSGRISRQE